LEAAKSIYEKLARDFNLQNINVNTVQCYNWIGWNLKSQKKYDNSIKQLHQALDVGLKKLGEIHGVIAQTHSNMGGTYWDKGDYQQALKNYQKSLAIRNKFFGAEHPSVAKSYQGIGIVYNAMGDYERALKCHQKSLAIRRKLLKVEDINIANSYNEIGIICRRQGDYDLALDYHQRSLAIKLRVLGEADSFTAMSYNNLGLIYSNKGEFDSALECYQKALSIWQDALGDDHPHVASVYNNIGIIYHEKGDYEQALQYHQKSLSIRLQLFAEEHPIILTNYNNIGRTYGERDDYDRAIEYHKKALSIGRRLYKEEHPEIAKSYLRLAEIYNRKGDFPLSLSYCQKAIISLVPRFDNEDIYSTPPLEAVSSEVNLFNALALKAKVFAQLSEKTGTQDLEMALATYSVVFERIDQMRTSYKAKGSKLFLSEETAQIYDQAIAAALKLADIKKKEKYKKQAFLFTEKSKSAVLQEGLAEAKAKQFSGLPAKLLEQEKQLRIDLAFYDTQIQKETLKKTSQENPRIKELKNNFFDLKTKYVQLIKDFEKNYPEYYDLKYQTGTLDVAKIQGHLQENTALLEFFVGNSMIYIFTISNDEFNVTSVDKDSAFSDLVADFYRSIRKGETDTYFDAATKLSRLLIAPIFEKIKSKEKIVLIPHDLLYKIPFEALLTKAPYSDSAQKKKRVDYSNLDYLVKTFDISYHYSASLYVNSRSEKTSSLAAETRPVNNFIGFAPVFAEDDPSGYTLASKDFMASSDAWVRSAVVDGKRFSELKYSEHEVQSIVELFSKKSGSKTGLAYFHTAATEEAFKTNIRNYHTIHIATHSFINEERPQLSGVVFAQPTGSAASEDGILYAGEAYNLDLNADLVVLSSCESGLGKLIRGEGMMALTRGFLYSGAANIIFSLWKVPDKHTSDLMVEFYKQFLSGKSHAEALRLAKLRMISNPGTARPRSWASFVLIGTN